MIYRFDRCELDTKRLELRRDGAIEAVEPQVFSLLVHLIEHRGHVVSKDDLIDAVWDGRIVSDATLSSRINAVRRAVGDNGTAQAIIKTMPRRGFRFVAELLPEESGEPAPASERYGAPPESPPASGFAAQTAGRPAVAVLPFANLSGDPAQDYFSDGLSEDIITLLSAWRSFPVVARNSSFAYKGRSQDVRQIAAALAARYVIEGSVRKSGNAVRVTAQLIDAETGHHLWAERFDGTLDDIFEIQDDITRRIVGSVEPQMERAERSKAATKRAANLSAWDCYLRGRELLYKITPTDNAQARAMFERAIELDPQYGDAYAGLSYTYQRDILLEIVDDRQAWVQKALETARRAVALAPESSAAHFSLSGAYIWADEHELAIAETRTAVELNPSNVHATLALGNRLDIVGQSDEGVPLLERALELNPRDPQSHIYFAQLARAYINARDYEKALTCLRESIRRKPDYPHTYHVLAICLGHLGRIDEARAAARQCDDLHPGFMQKRAYWNIYVDPSANQHLADGLRAAGLVD